jgi:hypothetical protein
MQDGEIRPNRVVTFDKVAESKPYKLNQVTRVPLPGNGVLNPGQSVSLPVWLRGNDIGGVHEVDLLFYYEPVKPQNKVKSVYTF